jgi:hypothetical protein
MLLDLPSEILVQILLYLTQSHPPSAVHCALVHPLSDAAASPNQFSRRAAVST